MSRREEVLLARVEKLNELGVALSAEGDTGRLLERILLGAQELTNADAGTLYRVSEDGRYLKFQTLRNGMLGITLGGTTGEPVPFPPISLQDDEGRPNHHSVAAYAALEGRTIHIPDAYAAEDFDFSATRRMDWETGYRSRSFLTMPLKNHEDEVVGVLQLINAQDPDTGAVVPFGSMAQRLAESLASQAAVVLTKKELIDGQRKLFQSFIQLIAKAIDQKNPTTGRHCERVPRLALMLADAALAAREGLFRDFTLTEDEYFELQVGAWLHDCGKITTPEEVLNKSTKLETLRDRLHEVNLRFEVLRRDAEIAALRRRLAASEGGEPASDEIGVLDAEHGRQLDRLTADRAFLAGANLGSEQMSPADQARVAAIGHRYRWRDADGVERPLLEADEIASLQIAHGTLSEEERRIMENHVQVTLDMLGTLPYPRNLRQVPDIAGSHHERMDGRGYPRGLRREQMSVQARMVALADVFEALSAADRPYKRAKSLSESLAIMGRMAENGHIDPDLFDCFVRQGVYLQYARRFLAPEQIDHVDLDALPGYTPRLSVPDPRGKDDAPSRQANP